MGPVTPAPGRTPKKNMLIQQCGQYQMTAQVQWIDPEQILLRLDRSDPEFDFNTQEFYLRPEELARLADYIMDTLAR